MSVPGPRNRNTDKYVIDSNWQPKEQEAIRSGVRLNRSHCRMLRTTPRE